MTTSPRSGRLLASAVGILIGLCGLALLALGAILVLLGPRLNNPGALVGGAAALLVCAAGTFVLARYPGLVWDRNPIEGPAWLLIAVVLAVLGVLGSVLRLGQDDAPPGGALWLVPAVLFALTVGLLVARTVVHARAARRPLGDGQA